jgi:hypothetical protein
MFGFVTDKSSPIPERSLNGGWYTGEPFVKNAEYGNISVLPFSAYWNGENLKSANPPLGALMQMQAGYRPGNNTDPQINGLQYINNKLCIPAQKCDGLQDKKPACNNSSCQKKIIYV